MESEQAARLPESSDRGFRGDVFLIFCVGLPLIALGFELLTHGSLLIFFDPIPTWLHVLLVASVPAIVAIADRDLRQGRTRRLVCAATGFAAGIALVYSLLFLPLLPYSAIAVVVFGIGLLPFAPVAGLIGALRRGRTLIRRVHGGGRLFAAGFFVAILVLAALELPGWMVIRGLQTGSIETLEFWGGRSTLLRAAQRGTHTVNLTAHLRSSLDVFSGGDDEKSLSRNRVLFYRLTGEDAAALPPPRLPGVDVPSLFGMERPRSRSEASELSLSSSRIDSVAFGDEGFAYLEWTLVFRNDADFQQEARARLQLPAGGVVTRANLWIDGEEREAAFGPRAQVREAYEAVVETRRDPLLVTSDRPGEAAIRAFPIPPRGETMRIRIGVTVPLDLVASDKAEMQLPVIMEHNFTIAADLEHDVWLDSRTPILSSPDGLESHVENGVATARGTLPLDESGRSVVVSRSADASETWTSDSTLDPAGFVRQRVAAIPASASRWIVVVDGSRAVERYREEIADALAAFDPARLAGLVVALDEPRWLMEEGSSDPSKALAALRSMDFRGGQDNQLALEAAWDRALLEGKSILWICGGQPIPLRAPDSFLQRLERRPDLEVVVVPLGTSTNALLDALPHPTVGVARLSDLRAGLGVLGSARSSSLAFVRERFLQLPIGVRVLPADHEATRQLARLWASDEVARQIMALRAETTAAASLATRYRVVTPVSGAVVLETDAQYETAGLRVPAPTLSDSMPVIPEPGTAVLIGLGLALLAAGRRSPATSERIRRA